MNLESERTDRMMRDALESVRSGIDFDDQSDSQVSDFQHQAVRQDSNFFNENLEMNKQLSFGNFKDFQKEDLKSARIQSHYDMRKLSGNAEANSSEEQKANNSASKSD